MILEGNERGYGAELARHLLNPKDNDHVTVHAIEGFMADDLQGAFAEAEAISGATQCQNYLFSLSLNPPMGETVSVEAFEDAVVAAERKLGLSGQPRAIVFHEKNGRRHAHAVWSRIKAAEMRAVEMPHYKRKLGDVSRSLYLKNEWDMPEGFRDAAKRDPTNYSRDEAGHAKRLKRDPKAIKAAFWRCWEMSDSHAAFAAALKDEGFLLARGERRGFVAVDAEGKIWSLSRWCGVKPKELRARLGPEGDLPSVEDVLSEIGQLRPRKAEPTNPIFDKQRADLVARQRQERVDLIQTQEARCIEEMMARRRRLPKGLRAAFLRVAGRYQKLIKTVEAEAEASRAKDRDEQQALINTHLAERRALEREFREAGLSKVFSRGAASDPRQTLVLPSDDLHLNRAQLLRRPERILDHLSYGKARFSRTDVLRGLAKRIDDPFELRDAADRVMASPELVKLDVEGEYRFTTRDYQSAETALENAAARLNAERGFGVSKTYITEAMRKQDAEMRRAFGGKLSAEQRSAIDHVLSDKGFASVVGLAGAGKSTMLATAMEAWRLQGVTVHGAALAGKAAEGLETASGIQSRTLASLEMSWENGYEPISHGNVLVIDEAGMIGTRQLGRIASKINEIGAKLVLVGDPDQLQPIEAGTPFRDLLNRHGAATLSEIHRHKDDWQKAASRDLAAGRIAEAVDAYEQRAAVTRGDDAFEALVETYAMDAAIEGGASVKQLAFAHKRKDVHALNLAIREALRPGETAQAETLFTTETGPRAFANGDRIVFGRNDKELGVKNGMLGTVQQVEDTKISVLLDGEPPQRLTFDPRRYRHFDHGYAVTIHKSQGATVDQAYVLTSQSMDHHLAYVAMTRHRQAMRLFVRDDDKPNWAQVGRREAFGRDPPRRSGPSMG